MIIIEGADKSGKTTFATHLSERIRLPVHTIKGAAGSKEEAIIRAKFALDNHDKFIFDGSPFINEAVYCVKRGENTYLEDQHPLYDELEKIGVRLVYCRPPDDYLLNPKKLGCKDYDMPKYVGEVLAKQRVYIMMYDALMKILPHIKYDFTLHTIEQFLGELHADNALDNNNNKEPEPDTQAVAGIKGGQ